MNKDKIKWLVILIIALASLLGYGLYNRNVILDKKIGIDQLEQRVNNYVKRIDQNLEVADIFIYNDSNYYFSIEEENTGKGAMELLVNPYTGKITPEQGPNMMWNEKYGMQGRRGHMYNGTTYFTNNQTDKLSRVEAVEIANNYVKTSINENYIVTNEGHEFYGYYTFHIEEGLNTVGMLSVNYYTGDVWYHNWHGELIEVISHHEKDNE